MSRDSEDCSRGHDRLHNELRRMLLLNQFRAAAIQGFEIPSASPLPSQSKEDCYRSYCLKYSALRR